MKTRGHSFSTNLGILLLSAIAMGLLYRTNPASQPSLELGSKFGSGSTLWRYHVSSNTTVFERTILSTVVKTTSWSGSAL